MDQQEAREVVNASLKDKPLVEVYDSLFVPPLFLQAGMKNFELSNAAIRL